MPSPIYNVTFLSESMQYTGSNSADILAAVTQVDFESESGGVLHLSMGETPFTLNTNDWIIWDIGNVTVLSNTQYLAERDCVAICSDVQAVADDVSELQTDVSSLEATVAMGATHSMGVAPVGALLLNASTTVAVTLNPAMPDSGYSAYAMLFAGTVSITGLQINSVTVVDTDTVDVVVQSVGVATLAGANVMVHAVN